MSFLDYVHPEDREKVLQRSLDRQRGKEVPGRYEIRLLTKTGEVWIDFGSTLISTQVTGGSGVAAHIQHRSLPNAIARSEEEFPHTEEAHRQRRCHCYGQIRYVNEPLSALCGWQQANLLGLSFDELIPAANAWRERHNAVTNFVEGAVRESEIVHRDGHLVPVEIVSRRIRLKGDEACGSRHAISAGERAGRRRQRRHHANCWLVLVCQHAGREMATGTAHELNQPLNYHFSAG